MPLPLLDLSPYISANRIIFFPADINKTNALEALADCAAQEDAVTDDEAFIRAIFEREEVSSTGIGQGVAVPHAKIETNQGFGITIGISASGIDYGATDDAPVHVMFMIAATDSERIAYLQLLATVANLLKQESIYQQLSQATTADAVFAALKIK